ncbi:hypothetical protein TELCIR_03877 [Teladorsagia circumcincta]|uniref:Reverse transcriptase domain-containing protein n=1 Tax=Teladorsagia circumcincta TaxID=45464 RepID=A0A2G9UV37_TELCI|nr:hypothetical protein TELCIR_03877 [Teladorsagia circumcincta]
MFADDIVLIGNDPSTLETSLKTLKMVAQSIGLEIDPGKTKWMKNTFTRDYFLRMEGSVIEEVSSYIYLGQAITMDNDLSIEIGRRRRAGWATFDKYRDLIRESHKNHGMGLKISKKNNDKTTNHKRQAHHKADSGIKGNT